MALVEVRSPCTGPAEPPWSRPCGVDAEFRVDVLDVSDDGAAADRELFGDAFVGAAGGQVGEDLGLAWRDRQAARQACSRLWSVEPGCPVG
jgi:hypothetical protein